MNYPPNANLLQWATLAIFVLSDPAFAQETASGLIPTMSYERPELIEANGEAINLEHHAVTRCYDCDQDGDLDLLVAGGDGRLWLYRNSGTPSEGPLSGKGTHLGRRS